MGVGQVISDTFGMVKARFGSLLGLWATYFALTMGVFIGMAIAIGATGMASLATMSGSDAMSAEGAMAGGAAMVLVVIVFYLGYLLVAMAQYASLIIMASPTERPTFGEALGAGWRAAPALLLLMIVLVVGYIVLSVPLAIFVAAFPTMGDGASAIFLVLLIPVLVWAGCRLSPLFAVIAVDRVRNPFAAIARAWRLTRGHALTIFLATLAFMVILVVVCGAVLLPSIGMLRSMADPAAMASGEAMGQALGGMALFGVSVLVVSVLFNLLYCAFMAVIHGTLSSASDVGTAETFA